MSDLTDERIEKLRLEAHAGSIIEMMATELQRHRSALAADRERVRSVLADVLRAAHQLPQTRYADTDAFIDEVAARAAEQLAKAGVDIGDEERDALLWAKQQAEQYVESSWYEKRSATGVTHAKRAAAFLDRLLGATK